MDMLNFQIMALAALVLGIIIYLMYREATRDGYTEQCAEDKKGWHGKKKSK